MSLTTFISKSEIKKEFLRNFKKPIFDLHSDIICESKTKNWTLVGMAFDYMLRFFIEYNNKNNVKKSEWVASGSLTFLEDNKRKYKLAKKLFNKSKNNYRKYLKNGKVTDDLITSTIHLAQLETICRSGIIDKKFGFVYKKDVDDVKNLISIIKKDTFMAKKLVILNPTFNSASSLVGGADADLVIDDTLIDIKTTKHLEFKRDKFNQLIGYYILYKIGGITNFKNVKIKKLGIYFSRYGILHTFNVDDCLLYKDLSIFIRWFNNITNEEKQCRITDFQEKNLKMLK